MEMEIDNKRSVTVRVYYVEPDYVPAPPKAMISLNVTIPAKDVDKLKLIPEIVKNELKSMVHLTGGNDEAEILSDLNKHINFRDKDTAIRPSKL